MLLHPRTQCVAAHPDAAAHFGRRRVIGNGTVTGDGVTGDGALTGNGAVTGNGALAGDSVADRNGAVAGNSTNRCREEALTQEETPASRLLRGGFGIATVVRSVRRKECGPSGGGRSVGRRTELRGGSVVSVARRRRPQRHKEANALVL